MLKAIENEVIKVSKADGYDEVVFDIRLVDTDSTIQIYKEEVKYLLEILNQAMDLIG